MSGARRERAIGQAVDDFAAYVGTLDLDETIGELVHMARFYGHVLRNERVAGMADRMAAIALSMLAERLRQLAVKPIKQPNHNGAVHSCTLLSRMLQATIERPT